MFVCERCMPISLRVFLQDAIEINIMNGETPHIYCPNCGKKVICNRNEQNVVKTQCVRCRRIIEIVQKAPKEYIITVEKPLKATT